VAKVTLGPTLSSARIARLRHRPTARIPNKRFPNVSQEVLYTANARKLMLAGVDALAKCRQSDARPKAQSCSQPARGTDHHEGRVTVAKQIELENRFEKTWAAQMVQ